MHLRAESRTSGYRPDSFSRFVRFFRYLRTAYNTRLRMQQTRIK
jgi:hypothetical protein